MNWVEVKLLTTCKVLPYNNKYNCNNFNHVNSLSRYSYINSPACSNVCDTVSFGARGTKLTEVNKHIGQILKEPLKKQEAQGFLKNLYLKDVKTFLLDCYRKGVAPADAFEEMIGAKKYIPKVVPVPSVTKTIGNVELTSLMDGEQIFKRALQDFQSAKKSIQLKMFEFQNITVDGQDWAPRGAENVPGYEEQRQLLETLINKKKENPKMKIQVILDVHKWNINSEGRKKHYNNQAMIVFLKKHDIDVVPASRDAILNHDKYYIVDGLRAMIGGMNFGTHSAANHDFCFAMKRLKGKKNSEIDTLMQDFNNNFEFAWYRIGTKRLVAGPLNAEEQKLYKGIDKKINPENVSYHEAMKEFFATPWAQTRYKKGKLDLIACNPMKKPTIEFVDTKPAEYAEIGKAGSETAFNRLKNEIKTSKEMFGELFYFTNKEFKGILKERISSGDLKKENVKFIIHEADFPYCKDDYFEMRDLGLDIRLYNEDKTINQRMHGKWAVFDNKRIFVGSPNWSDRALMQNLGKGFRKDTPLTSKDIDDRIFEIIDEVKTFEDTLHLPNVVWDGTQSCFEALKKRIHILNSAYNKLNETGKVSFTLDNNKYTFIKNKAIVEINGVRHHYEEPEGRETLAILRKITGKYGNIYERHNSKAKYSRGNCESAIVVDSKEFVDEVFKPQFIKDWEYSKSEFEELNKKKLVYIPPTNN